MIRLKNDKQISEIRKSCKLLAQMFEYVIPKVTVGISTKDIDDLCLEFITKHGGKPAWYKEDFPGAACVSVNDAVIHGLPSRKIKIRDGDLVSIDVTDAFSALGEITGTTSNEVILDSVFSKFCLGK